jgi:hypothetical protein
MRKNNKETPDPTIALTREIEDASAFLYRFYFHKEPFTSRDVNGGIMRLQALCKEMKRQFGSGEHSAWSESVINISNGHIESARKALKEKWGQ